MHDSTSYWGVRGRCLFASSVGWLKMNESIVRVLFIGAGAVNFGGTIGPWDHSRRLEQLGGVQVVAIADPDLPKAQEVLKSKLDGQFADMYKGCIVMANYLDAIETTKPHVAFIGVPPFYHGSLEPSKDIELQCLRAGVHIFVEKPVSVVLPEQYSDYVQAVEQVQKERGLVLSVGYMFRYHPAIQQMKSTLEKYNRPVMGINARYNCAYSKSYNGLWWDKARSGGPVVEQATHFCDLMRYIGGEVRQETISALAVPASDDAKQPGYLSCISPLLREDSLERDHRIPRLTAAHWLFQSGAVGNLTHIVSLHGVKYEATIEVWADGLRMILEEPYRPDCKLRVRRGEEEEKVYEFPSADPYFNEDKTFLEAVRSGNCSIIQSTYSDAAKSYQLSWDVRRSSETTGTL